MASSCLFGFSMCQMGLPLSLYTIGAHGRLLPHCSTASALFLTAGSCRRQASYKTATRLGPVETLLSCGVPELRTQVRQAISKHACNRIEVSYCPTPGSLGTSARLPQCLQRAADLARPA
jgi:hypothetical protein